MDTDKYREFSAHLKNLVKDERDHFVIDKKVILTASAVIDDLLFKLNAERSALSSDKIVKKSLSLDGVTQLSVHESQ